jgi:hypothetical protein
MAAVPAGEKEKAPTKVSADEIAKEFKDDAAAAKKKYGTKPLPEIQISGSATLEIGSRKKKTLELVVETSCKTTIRIAVDDPPAKYPAKFSATVTYKDYFSMGTVQELALKASKIRYDNGR